MIPPECLLTAQKMRHVLPTVLFHEKLSTKSCTTSMQSCPLFFRYYKTLLNHENFCFTPRNTLHYDSTEEMRSCDWPLLLIIPQILHKRASHLAIELCIVAVFTAKYLVLF
jgi:hypothetical protein